MNKEYVLFRVALALTASLFVSSSIAGNAIGNDIAYIPVEEKKLHGLSEFEWEKVAGGDPVEQIQEGFVHTPSAEIRKEQHAYSCILPAGHVKDQIHTVFSCLGFKGGVWRLGDVTTTKNTAFGADHPHGVLQAIVEHFNLQGKAIVYSNGMVAFAAE